MGRGFILGLAVSGLAVCGALATGPGLAFATASAAARPLASAAAPVWGTAQGLPGIALAALDDGDVAASLTLSCSSPGNCAVGGSYDVPGEGPLSSAFVADQRNGTWGKAIEVPGMATLNVGEMAEVNSISCTSAGECVAGGAYSPGGIDAGEMHPALEAFVVTGKDGTWGTAIEVPGITALNAGHSASVSSVSCWSPGDCTAAGTYAVGAVGIEGVISVQAFVVTEKDGTWGRATQLPGLAALNIGELARVSSISCTAGGNCAVGGDYAGADSFDQQAFVADESAGTWLPAEEVPGTGALNTFERAGVSSVSCASPGNCGAAGYYATGYSATGYVVSGAFVASETNGVWHTADAISDGINADSVSCASAGNCVAGGSFLTGSTKGQQNVQAFVITERNNAWGRLQPVAGLAGLNIGQTAGIESVSCSAPGDCAAGGYYAGKKSDENQADDQAFVVIKTDGTWGRAEEVPGISALTATDDATVDAVSCVSPQACTAAGTYSTGNGFVVSTETPTATTESLSASTVTYGQEQAERVSVTVTAKTGGPPAGKVTVSTGSATLCAITLRSARGSCTLTARRLGPGTYRLTAAYPGGPDFASSVSRAETLTVVTSSAAAGRPGSAATARAGPATGSGGSV